MALALLFAPAVGRLAEHRHRADGPADAHRNGDAAPGVPSRRAWVDAARSALRLPVGCVAHAARLQCIPRGRLLRLSCAADAAAARARTQGGERSVRPRPRAARRPRLPRPHDAPLAAHARPGTVRDTSETRPSRRSPPRAPTHGTTCHRLAFGTPVWPTRGRCPTCPGTLPCRYYGVPGFYPAFDSRLAGAPATRSWPRSRATRGF